MRKNKAIGFKKKAAKAFIVDELILLPDNICVALFDIANSKEVIGGLIETPGDQAGIEYIVNQFIPINFSMLSINDENESCLRVRKNLTIVCEHHKKNNWRIWSDIYETLVMLSSILDSNEELLGILKTKNRSQTDELLRAILLLKNAYPSQDVEEEMWHEYWEGNKIPSPVELKEHLFYRLSFLKDSLSKSKLDEVMAFCERTGKLLYNHWKENY